MMVKTLYDALCDGKVWANISKFGFGIVAACLCLGSFLWSQQKLTDHSIKMGTDAVNAVEKSAEALQKVAVSSERVAANTDRITDMEKVQMQDLKNRASEHADQCDKMEAIRKGMDERITIQDTKLDLLAKGVEAIAVGVKQNGEAMAESLKTQTAILKRIEEKK